MPPKMEDVARRAGVSKSTVSFVLNDKPGVSQETIEAVLRAADELGYHLPPKRPVRKPQSQQKYFTVVHQIGQEDNENIYGLFADYLHGIRTFAQQANINITAISGYRKGDLERLESQILEDEKTPLDGLIHMGAGVHRESRLLHRAIDLDIPQVVLSRNWPGLNISTVGQDHTRQAEIALEHLISLGHTRIGFVANTSDSAYEWFDIRLACYRKKMEQVNPQAKEDWIMLGENGAVSARELITHNPEITAIFAIHDGRAFEVMQGLFDAGRSVPEDISVIGVDGSEETPPNLPDLTTVGISHYDVGYLAAEILLKQVENQQLDFGNLIVRSHLIEGESCRSIESETS